jgi:pimeloyl-ACP methyl ester carboxylesterase
MLSADRSIDYVDNLNRIQTPTLLVAGDGDIMSDVPSTELMLAKLGSPDKLLMRFGRSGGYVADYGHCDLVWSRHASKEIFPPIIDWLDRRQPGVAASKQSVGDSSRSISASKRSPEVARVSEGADMRR